MPSTNERTDPLQAVFNFASLIEESNEPAKIAEYAVQLYHFWGRLLELTAKNQQRTLERTGGVGREQSLAGYSTAGDEPIAPRYSHRNEQQAGDGEGIQASTDRAHP